MAEIVNLRRERKRKRRDDAAKAAEENRVVHGMSAAQKKAERLARALDERRLEGHRRGGDGEADGG